MHDYHFSQNVCHMHIRYLLDIFLKVLEGPVINDQRGGKFDQFGSNFINFGRLINVLWCSVMKLNLWGSVLVILSLFNMLMSKLSWNCSNISVYEIISWYLNSLMSWINHFELKKLNYFLSKMHDYFRISLNL